MIDSIKITSLTNIGANIAYNTIFPLVNTAGTPVTQKGNLQIIGNLILNGAGGSYFPPVAQAVLAQSVTNSAQPNITSVGTLTSLNISGRANLGSVTNVAILGGVNGQYLQTDGTGNLVWVSGGGSGNGVVGGANAQIQFNNSGSFGGTTGLVWSASNTTLVTTNIAAGTVKTDNYKYANGAPFNGTYSNANVSAYLPTYTGNMNANRYTGDGSGLSNITVQYANVANLVAVGNVLGIGNIATLGLTGNGAQVLYGNGLFTTAYGNANVANYLPTYLGNVGANTIIGAGNLKLQPNVANSYAYLDIYLTTGPDIHIASNSENLILGRDGTANVTIGVNGTVSIQATTGTPHVWTFGADGTLNLPESSSVGNSIIQTTSNIQLNSNSNTWTFGSDGNLTLPGDLKSIHMTSLGANGPGIQGNTGANGTMYVRANATNDSTGLYLYNDDDAILYGRHNVVLRAGGPGGTSFTFDNGGLASAIAFKSSPSPLADLQFPGQSGLRAFINDANLVAVGNFGQIVGGGGSNIVPVFYDGTNWRIG
jgi:hypothetical protein